MSFTQQGADSLPDIDQLMPVKYQYAGFWPRFLAAFIDSFLYFVLLLPLGILFDSAMYHEFYGAYSLFDLMVQLLFAVVYIVCWMYFAATPGKVLMGLRVVDAKTGNKINFKQALVRYLGYIISALVCFLGYIWVVFDDKKQAWHDKMADTVVIKEVE